jgi:FSR family fosmidomycin resistance protein-like MFS transporter
MTLAIIAGSIGSSFFHPQALGLASKFALSDASMGIFISLGALGYSTGPIVSSWITQFWGLDAMPVLAIPGVLCALLMFKAVPKISYLGHTHINLKKAVKDILGSRKLNILNLVAMLKTFVTSSTTILLPFLWKDLGYNPFQIGVIIFAFLCASALGSFSSRYVERLISTKAAFYVSLAATLPLMIAFALVYQTYPTVSFVIFTVMGFVTSLAMPTTMVMAQEVLPEYKSIISGFINGFSWGIMAVFVSATGFVAQKFGIINVLVTVTVFPAVFSPMVEKLFRHNKVA